MENIFLNVAAYTCNSNVWIAGGKFVLWLQGCDKNCKGCLAPLWREKKENILIWIDELFEKIYLEKRNEGIVISGGEPLLQYDNLLIFLEKVKKYTKLGVILYSGYEKDIIDLKFKKIYKFVDLLIAGNYNIELDNDKGIIGSTNKDVIFITDRYEKYKEEIYNKERMIELKFFFDNILFVGVPSKKYKNIVL